MNVAMNLVQQISFQLKCITKEQQEFLQIFRLECDSYAWCHMLYSSPEIVFPDKSARGKKSFEINIRSVITF